MKTETLETIIEELASALSLERWKIKAMEEELLKLRKENKELKEKEKENG